MGWSRVAKIGRARVQESLTEDELFRRGEHVDGESHLVLVDLQSHPADEAGQNPEEESHDCRFVGLLE